MNEPDLNTQITEATGKQQEPEVTEVQPARQNGFTSMWRKLRPGDFLRQLAVVVIGIVITFQGSALIERSAQRKETAHVLNMVKSELLRNKTMLEDMRNVLESDFRASRALIRYAFEPEKAPSDTLDRYLLSLLNVRSFQAPSNSFEVLKRSSQIQTFRDKTLLSTLFSIYEQLNMLTTVNVESYYTIKGEGLIYIVNSMDSRAYFESMQGERKALFVKYISHDPIRNALLGIANGNFEYLIPSIDEIAADINTAVERIERENS